MSTTSISLRAPRRRSVWMLLASVTIIGIVFIGVYPTRTYLSQRGSLRTAEHRLDVLRAENAKLEQEAADLNTDSRIETEARAKYNLVHPGQEAFAILPAPPPKLAVPSVWPFTGLAEKLSK